MLCTGFLLATTSEGYSCRLLTEVGRLLIAVASLVAEHRLEGMQASALATLGLSGCVWRRGLVAPRRVKSSQILIHCTTSEVPNFFPFKRKIPRQVPLSWFSKACHNIYKSLHGLAMDKHYVLNNSGIYDINNTGMVTPVTRS